MNTQSASSTKSVNTNKGEERKTFVFYGSWYQALSRFPANIQLPVYNAVIRYALYGEEISDSENDMVRLAFELIRTNIDMAQAEYDAKIRTCRRAAQKRWAKANEESTEESQPQTAKESTTSTTMPEPQASEPQTSEPQAPDTKDKAPSQQITPQEFVADFMSEARSTQLDGLAKELGVTRSDLDSMTRSVVAEWTMTDTKHKTYAEAARHLVNTLRKKTSHRRKEMTAAPTSGSRSNSPDTQPKLGVGEFFNERGERTYASGRVVVPLNAPPRPSKNHWWHETCECWMNSPF